MQYDVCVMVNSFLHFSIGLSICLPFCLYKASFNSQICPTFFANANQLRLAFLVVPAANLSIFIKTRFQNHFRAIFRKIIIWLPRYPVCVFDSQWRVEHVPDPSAFFIFGEADPWSVKWWWKNNRDSRTFPFRLNVCKVSVLLTAVVSGLFPS